MWAANETPKTVTDCDRAVQRVAMLLLLVRRLSLEEVIGHSDAPVQPNARHSCEVLRSGNVLLGARASGGGPVPFRKQRWERLSLQQQLQTRGKGQEIGLGSRAGGSFLRHLHKPEDPDGNSSSTVCRCSL
ncbi:hypothetical protein Slala04_02360 [Streptomyces lavendulae subsp. lavendulae]|nr:hypothetical protein Slala04_02360 [Streptomyces lavendulae subsp. lavendulae]